MAVTMLAAAATRESISASGRVSRVGQIFAYVCSEQYGSVFVPVGAAVPPETFFQGFYSYFNFSSLISG